MQIQFDNITLNVRPHQVHEWALTTAEVAEGYGVSSEAIRSHKSRNADEFTEGKHFVSVANCNAVGNQADTYWTKKGVVRLGFFIRSERAKRFRDWAEDLIINAVQQYALPQTYKEALTELLQKVEENERLQAENEALKPIAQYAENVLLSQSELLTTVIAKELGKSAVTLNKILKDRGIQHKVGNTRVLNQRYADKGYTRMRTHVHSTTSGKMRTEHHLVWTEKGRQFIHSLVNPKLDNTAFAGNQPGAA